MKTKCLVRILSILLVALLVQGCAYTRIQRPLDTDYDRTSLGTKVGYSHARSILWLFAWGDGGTKAAAENGDIVIIRHADIQYKVVLFGLYARVTTVVYGD